MSGPDTVATVSPPLGADAPSEPQTPSQEGASQVSAQAVALAAMIQRALAAGDENIMDEEALQTLMAALCKTYSAMVENGSTAMPLNKRGGVTATDVMIVSGNLLRAADLQVFELGMWQGWTGR